MANFLELAKAVGQKQSIDSSEQLDQLNTQKASMNQSFDMAIGQVKMKQTEQKAQQSQIKFEEQKSKLKADLIKGMIDKQQAGGSVAVGGDMLGQFANIPTDGDARDMPMIDANSRV